MLESLRDAQLEIGSQSKYKQTKNSHNRLLSPKHCPLFDTRASQLCVESVLSLDTHYTDYTSQNNKLKLERIVHCLIVLNHSQKVSPVLNTPTYTQGHPEQVIRNTPGHWSSTPVIETFIRHLHSCETNLTFCEFVQPH